MPLEPGPVRRPTITDVAREAGVSRAAVSKVIRDAAGVSPGMRLRVTAAIEQLSYRPSAAARAMRGSSYTIGLEMPPLANPFLSLVLDGARAALAATPYQLIIAPADGAEYGAIEVLADRQVDGIVAISPLVEPAWLERLTDRVPVVMLGRHDDTEHYDSVVNDDVAGTRAVMSHLLGLGHRRVAHLTESEAVTAPGSGTPHAVRLQTYREVMFEAGLGRQVRVARVEGGAHGARRAAAALLDRDEPPTAVFAAHDQLAVDVLAEVAFRGLSARELSVVGYDDIDIASHPAISLTSVDQCGVEMGERSVGMLLERFAGRRVARRHVTTPTLRVRRSTAAPMGV